MARRFSFAEETGSYTALKAVTIALRRDIIHL